MRVLVVEDKPGMTRPIGQLITWKVHRDCSHEEKLK